MTEDIFFTTPASGRLSVFPVFSGLFHSVRFWKTTIIIKIIVVTSGPKREQRAEVYE